MYNTQNGWTKERMKQEIQEKMLGHCSVDDEGDCVYRAPDGNRCAVGVFLPDAAYRETMETLLVSDFYSDIHMYMPLGLEGMYELQDRHDGLVRNEYDPRPALLAWIDKNVQDAA